MVAVAPMEPLSPPLPLLLSSLVPFYYFSSFLEDRRGEEATVGEDITIGDKVDPY